MDLTRYVETLRRELAVAADAGGDEARALAERLTAPLEPATRLMLLDALSAAAEEITREIAPGSVDVRLRSGEPELVVTPPAAHEPAEPTEPPTARRRPDSEDAATARITLRVPEHIKAAAEQAPARERLSVNAWLVRVVAAAIANDGATRSRQRRGRVGESYTGWVR